MKLKETFSTIAHQYDQSRVDYPPTVFRDIIKYVKLTKKDPILEIGIGTGKATYPFARLKNPILANDISPALVKVAKLKLKKYPNVKYIIGQFENINLPKNNFKLIFSAQTFHWITSSFRFTKPARLLKENGVLALFWNAHYYNKGVGKMAIILHNKYSRAKGGKADVIISKLLKHKLFTDGFSKEYPFITRQTKQQYINLQTSYSWYLALSKKRKIKTLAELKQKLKKYPATMKVPMRTKLVLARKKIQ